MKTKIQVLIMLIFIFALVWMAYKSSIKGLESVWNKVLTQSYKDEPQYKDYKIASSSAWIVPADPDVIRELNESDWMTNLLAGDFPLGLKMEEVESAWDLNPLMRDSLDEFIKDKGLGANYRDFFYKGAQVPHALEHYDVTGDGVKEQIFRSTGAGCTSCHTQFIDIVNEENTYSTKLNKGIIYPRSDRKGFYLENSYTGEEFAKCCTDNFIIGKYEWNGSGFTEIARKRIWLASTNQP